MSIPFMRRSFIRMEKKGYLFFACLQLSPAEKMNCKYCGKACIRKGFQSNGKQKYLCVCCKKYQQASYQYLAYDPLIRKRMNAMIKRGCGILDMAFLLEIGKNSVLRLTRRMAAEVNAPVLQEKGQEYEADEFHTVIRGKEKQDIYVSYVINRASRQTLNFCVGSRDKVQLGNMLHPVLISDPKCIYTDGWASYRCVIPESIHCTGRHQTNRIERKHLTLRTRIKRISRNFMSQSRSTEMLVAYLTIYFWG
jgi:insertion element IS1 protein InsB